MSATATEAHMDDKYNFLEEIQSEDERTFALGDVLDVKASIWLVVITFLAGQTAYFLSRGLSPHLYDGQLVSCLFLGIAGLLTLFELRPRKYDFFSPSNGVIEARLAQLREHYKAEVNADELAQKQILEDQVGWTKAAIVKNQRINKFKGDLVDWSFWLTTAAATINLLTLLSFFKLPF
jgi:hypothetical protein